MYDVIVVGLGAMGSAAAYHLTKRGLSVLGVEQYSMAHALGSSHGETRLIRKAYFENSAYVPLLECSYELWNELEKETETSLLHQTGLAIFGAPSSPVLKGSLASSRLFKIPVTEHSHAESVQLFPQFEIPKDFISLVEPSGGYLEVENCVRAFCEASKNRGAELLFETRVKQWKSRGTRFEIETDIGHFSSRYGVFTAGAWTGDVLKSLSLPLKVHRVPQFWFESKATQKEVCFAFDMPYGFMYGFPKINGLQKVAAHIPGEIVFDPATVDRKISENDISLTRQFVGDQLKKFQVDPVKSSVCMYTMTPDSHFILDVLPEKPNCVLAAGFSGHGFKFASSLGEVLTRLLLKDPLGYDINFLRLNRF